MSKFMHDAISIVNCVIDIDRVITPGSVIVKPFDVLDVPVAWTLTLCGHKAGNRLGGKMTTVRIACLD